MCNPIPELLRPIEAARLLHVTPTTLRRWYHSGQIHVIKTPGGNFRYLAEEIHNIRGDR